MRKPLFIAAMFLFYLAPLVGQEKARKGTEVFEATIIRIEPWGPIKISCGVAIVYRLAEYRVETVHRGHFHNGDDIVLEHLACNGNELDDLNAGDKVIVVAEKLSQPDKHPWSTIRTAADSGAECADRKTENCEQVRLAPQPKVTVWYRALKVAKLVYPTARPSER